MIIAEDDDTEGEVKKKKPSVRRKSQDDYSKKLNFKKEIKKSDSILIDNDMCKRFHVNYVLEAVAYIILAKDILQFKIWTPYGFCSVRKISNQNYVAGNQTKYSDLIEKLRSNDQIIKDINKFLFWKLPLKFKINVSKNKCETIRNINNQLEKFIKKGNNKVAAEMCGVFISEMIRTSGKVIRSAFKEWPKSVEDLHSRFVQSSKSGNVGFREYIKNPSSVSEKIRKAIEKNVEGFSDSE